MLNISPAIMICDINPLTIQWILPPSSISLAPRQNQRILTLTFVWWRLLAFTGWNFSKLSQNQNWWRNIMINNPPIQHYLVFPTYGVTQPWPFRWCVFTSCIFLIRIISDEDDLNAAYCGFGRTIWISFKRKIWSHRMAKRPSTL